MPFPRCRRIIDTYTTEGPIMGCCSKKEAEKKETCAAEKTPCATEKKETCATEKKETCAPKKCCG